MNLKQRLSYLLIGAVMVGLTACPSKSPEKPPVAPDSVATDTNTKKQAQDFFHSLPSPLHVAKMFNRSKLKYVNGIANPIENATKYNSQISRALNLGVYSTDLAYATLNNQTQVAINTFKSVRTLSEGLNLSSVFESTNLIPRFERNIGNKDSLVMLMADLHMESDILLKETERYDVVYTSFAGAWTEAMYIATNLTYKQQNPDISDRVLQQQATLSKLIELLSEFQKDKSAEPIVTGLKDIRTVLEKLNALGKPATDPEYQKIFSDELYPKIQGLRNSIINQQ